MNKKIVAILIMTLFSSIALPAFGIINHPPSHLKLIYDGLCYENSFMVFALDEDGDEIRYGASWNNNRNVDFWSDFYPSGETVIIYAGYNITGKVGVIAEDVYGAQSDWGSVRSKTKNINTPFLTFLENHPNLFPLLRKILGL